MPSDVDAVIAALRMVLQEAERRTRTSSWDIHTVNQWIGQLPGAWAGRWRRLRLKPSYSGGSTAYREEFLTHVRATLAYLETNRDAIAAQSPWWPLAKAARQAAAKRNEVAVNAPTAAAEKPPEDEQGKLTTPRQKWLH